MKMLFEDNEVMELFNSKAKIYSNGKIELRKYGRTIARKKEGYERVDKSESALDYIKSKKSNKKSELKEIRHDNLVRSRNIIIDYACENESCWRSFITLTFAENISDVEQANKHLHTWKTIVQRKMPDFKALIVPEFQRRGAVHYHMLSNIECGSELIPQREQKNLYKPSENNYTILQYYDLKYWKYGFSSAYDLSKTDDNFNPALYITKYLYKDLDNRFYGRKKVLTAGKLRKPSTIYMFHSERYTQALEYIKERGYEYKEYEPALMSSQQLPVVISTANLSCGDMFDVVHEILV